MNLTPDDIVYAKLATLFDSSVIGPGPLVYHSPGGDPVAPYVTYRRTNTEDERDLAGNLAMQTIEYDVEISSQFFSQLDVDLSSLDNWTSSGWYFNLTNQSVSEDQFSLTVSLSACKAF